MQIFAQRGYASLYPENTMTAFRKALEAGADGISLEARMTNDGHIVIMHDASVDRTTTGTGIVRDLSFAEIRSLDAGIKKGLVFEGEQVPALEEVFVELGGKLILNVELANYEESDERVLADMTGDLIEKYHLEDSVIISSFRFNNLVYMKDKHPNIPTALLCQPGIRGLISRNILNHSLSVDALHPFYKDVSPSLVRKEQQCGRKVRAWTIREDDDILKMFNLGVDAIFAEDPLQARQLYESEKVLRS